MGWFWLSVVTLLLFGLTGVTQKISTNHVSTPFSFLGFAVAFLPITAFIVVSIRLNWNLTGPVILLGLLGGALNGFGTLASFGAFESGGKASVVMPLISLYPLITVLCAKLFLHEQITPLQWAGIALTPLAATLLSLED